MKKILSYYKNKRVAVSGATGFLGSCLLAELSKYSKLTYGFSRKKKIKLGKLKIIKVDLCKLADVNKIINKFDIFFIFGANTNLDKAEKNHKYNYNSNVKPITNLIRCANFQNKKIKIIFSSTGTVFGLNKKKIISEDIVPEPVTIYDKHKLLVEKILEINAKLNLIESVSLRIQNVYGKSFSKSKDKTRGVLNKIIKNSVKGNSIQAYGGGDYYRDFLHISDLINAIMFAGISKKINGMTLNIGSNKSLKFIQVCKIIKSEILKLKNKSIKILSVKWPKRHNLIDKRDYVLNSKKFGKLTKWKQKININNGIRDTINFFDRSH